MSVLVVYNEIKEGEIQFIGVMNYFTEEFRFFTNKQTELATRHINKASQAVFFGSNQLKKLQIQSTRQSRCDVQKEAAEFVLPNHRNELEDWSSQVVVPDRFKNCFRAKPSIRAHRNCYIVKGIREFLNGIRRSADLEQMQNLYMGRRVLPVINN